MPCLKVPEKMTQLLDIVEQTSTRKCDLCNHFETVERSVATIDS